jgi:hypothetical protein
VNVLRAILYEYGHPVPQGLVQLTRIRAILAERDSDLPMLVREECLDLLEQVAGLTRTKHRCLHLGEGLGRGRDDLTLDLFDR